MKRRIIALVLILALGILLPACSSSDGEPEDTTPGQVTQNTQDEKENGEEPEPTTNDGDDDTDAGSNGQDWPSDKLPSDVPELKNVTITGITTLGGQQVMVMFEDGDRDTIEDYIEDVNDEGWTEFMNVSAGEGLQVILEKDGATVQITWSDGGDGAVFYAVE